MKLGSWAEWSSGTSGQAALLGSAGSEVTFFPQSLVQADLGKSFLAFPARSPQPGQHIPMLAWGET